MMDLDPPAQRGSDSAKPSGRKPWIKPVVKQLRAGSAEQTPGSTISDGFLEAIGS